MYVNDTDLRNKLKEVLRTKTRNQIVTEIKNRTGKFHQYQIDKFLQGNDVSLNTAIKLDEYLLREQI
ncbi:hypothetical protein UFOVP280_12 [uncultured Caudovirales phage]|jgi:hypothetical protein|uniref:Uncharacterized protein n=1 Tax=uncultured Caudovirales phage TaxID=2100421 RepID=A0A6J5LSC0_9CAUD|nr:hypothetical protein UFOVP280_12 [uncultured Caudovirales phage]